MLINLVEYLVILASWDVLPFGTSRWDEARPSQYCTILVKSFSWYLLIYGGHQFDILYITTQNSQQPAVGVRKVTFFLFSRCTLCWKSCDILKTCLNKKKTNQHKRSQTEVFCLDGLKDWKSKSKITSNWYLSTTIPLSCCLEYFYVVFLNIFSFIMGK